MQVVKYYLLWYTFHLQAKAVDISNQTLLATAIACCICSSFGQVRLNADRPGIFSMPFPFTPALRMVLHGVCHKAAVCCVLEDLGSI